MFGIVLASVGTFLSEVSGSIGKWEISRHQESRFTFVAVNMFWSVIIFWGIALLVPGAFIFKWASLPIFVLRLAFEVTLAYVAATAVARADRSTFAFLYVGTVPLLLIADLILGYELSGTQRAGIALILAVFTVIAMGKTFNKNAVAHIVFSMVCATFTVTLFKWNITHYNSVAAEQALMCTLQFLIFTGLAWALRQQNVFAFLIKKTFFAQSASHGASIALESFALMFAPASVIIAAKRSSNILWSTLFGNKVFHERGLAAKLLLLPIIATSLFLLGR